MGDIEIEYELDDDVGLLSIQALEFYGEYETSEDGEWIIAWDTIGHVKRIGNVVLLKKGDRIQHTRITNPELGKVANNGFVIIANVVSAPRLQSDILVFAPGLKPIIRKRINALLFNNAISKSGIYSIWQAANNPRSQDGDSLFFIDHKSKELLWRIMNSEGWPEKYEFDEEHRYLSLFIKDRDEPLKISFSGEVL